jgi:hypothetical protein
MEGNGGLPSHCTYGGIVLSGPEAGGIRAVIERRQG